MVKKKFMAGAVAAAVLALGGSLLTAAPASAAEIPFGYLNCVQGSIRTQGHGTNAQTHSLNQGGTVFVRNFPSSGAAYVTRTWYSGVKISSHGSVYTPGVLSWANQNCSD